jgi:hypothetical protein
MKNTALALFVAGTVILGCAGFLWSMNIRETQIPPVTVTNLQAERLFDEHNENVTKARISGILNNRGYVDAYVTLQFITSWQGDSTVAGIASSGYSTVETTGQKGDSETRTVFISAKSNLEISSELNATTNEFSYGIKIIETRR